MSTIIMILLISILILVHEAGHFFAARMFKIKVDKFGIGLPIGPTLWEKKVGDVTLVVHAFLFGGYVSFPDDDKDSEVPQDSQDRILNRPIWQRAIVFSAGVMANVICAYVLVLMTAFMWHNLPSGRYHTYVKDIVPPKHSNIKASGIKKGDRIVKINGSKIKTKYAVNLYAMYSASYDGKAPKENIEENYKELKRFNPAFEKNEIISKGLVVKLVKPIKEEPTVLSDGVLNGTEVYTNSDVPLNEAQIKLRTKIRHKKFIVADGTFSLSDLAYAMSDTNKPINMVVLRKKQRINLKKIYANHEGVIGIVTNKAEVLTPIKGIKSAFSESWNYLNRETKSMLIVLGQLFTGKIPLKNLHGVVLITKLGGDIISQDGIFHGILLTAVISMNLAILNILPIPALDGGHLLFLLIEKIMGKPVNEKIANKIMTVFFALLILLLIFVLFNDIYVLVKPMFVK